MGKSVNSRNRRQRHNPLIKDIDSQYGKLKNVSKDQELDNGSDEDEFVDAQATRKILQLAKKQQDEIEEENDTVNKNQENNMARFYTNKATSSDDDEEDQNISEFEPDNYEDEEDEIIEIDEEDATMFDEYFKRAEEFNSSRGSYNLADKIMASIKQKSEELKSDIPRISPSLETKDGVQLPPKVIKAYLTVGSVLKTWTHGKLPKLFKVIPSLNSWQDVLYITNPHEWSPHVVYEATKLFVSNLSAKEAQKFINLVLLERFRENIETSEDHSLNYHIYRAIKKSLYKPAAFFKGFLFPLVETGCNVREAKIAGSILTKVSVPALHSSAALSYLLRLQFSPATTVFIKILLEKKYALPYQTVDECVFYFMKFRILDDNSNSEDSTRTLPVVWHKAFLSFAQRYKNDITQDQRDFLLETVRQRGHREIGPEVRRELLAGKSREFVNEDTDVNDLMIDVQ